VLGDIPIQHDPRILVDFRTSDDAGVYLWEGGPALVQTVDFFTPIVDDPYAYGQIAAANALSDVYAMGGTPMTALAIAAFPEGVIEPADIRAIFRGGFDTLREAGVALLGGHTVKDTEIKFGYAVTGAIDPARIFTNAGARAGDVLFLTKPLGTGVIGTAIKFDRTTPDVVDAAVASMRTLNKKAADVLREAQGVHACTDITGFGLIGHGCEMAVASAATLTVVATSIPVLRGARALVRQNRSGGMASNREYFQRLVNVDASVDPDTVDLAYDPQTSGGLLISIAPDAADAIQDALEYAGVTVARVGHVVPAGAFRVAIQ